MPLADVFLFSSWSRGTGARLATFPLEPFLFFYLALKKQAITWAIQKRRSGLYTECRRKQEGDKLLLQFKITTPLLEPSWMGTSFPVSWSSLRELYSHPSAVIAPGYRLFLPLILDQCLTSGRAHLLWLCWYDPTIPSVCPDISKVSDIVISKHAKHQVHFHMQSDSTFWIIKKD